MAFTKTDIRCIDKIIESFAKKYKKEIEFEGNEFHKLNLEKIMPYEITYGFGKKIEEIPFYIPSSKKGIHTIKTPENLVRLSSGILIDEKYCVEDNFSTYKLNKKHNFWIANINQ